LAGELLVQENHLSLKSATATVVLCMVAGHPGLRTTSAANCVVEVSNPEPGRATIRSQPAAETSAQEPTQTRSNATLTAALLMEDGRAGAAGEDAMEAIIMMNQDAKKVEEEVVPVLNPNVEANVLGLI